MRHHPCLVKEQSSRRSDDCRTGQESESDDSSYDSFETPSTPSQNTAEEEIGRTADSDVAEDVFGRSADYGAAEDDLGRSADPGSQLPSMPSLRLDESTFSGSSSQRRRIAKCKSQPLSKQVNPQTSITN